MTVGVAAVAVAAAFGCAPRRVATPATRPELIVLLPDSERESPGRAIVSNAAGSVDLVADRDSTVIMQNQPPRAAMSLSESEVQMTFGEALSLNLHRLGSYAVLPLRVRGTDRRVSFIRTDDPRRGAHASGPGRRCGWSHGHGGSVRLELQAWQPTRDDRPRSSRSGRSRPGTHRGDVAWGRGPCCADS